MVSLEKLTYSQAKSILGSRGGFFGCEDWQAFFGEHGITETQFLIANDFPWTRSVLNGECELCGGKVRDCHFAIFGIPSFNDDQNFNLKMLHGQKVLEVYEGWGSFQGGIDLNAQPFFMETLENRWYLCHIGDKPNYFQEKTYAQQQALLLPNYEVPPAIVEVSARVLRKLKYPTEKLEEICVGTGSSTRRCLVDHTERKEEKSVHYRVLCQEYTLSENRDEGDWREENRIFDEQKPIDGDAYKYTRVGIAAMRKLSVPQ